MSGKTYIVEEGPNPSTDYFVLPALTDHTDQVIRCSWTELPTVNDLIGATVVFVRYVPASWRRLIAAVKQAVIHDYPQNSRPKSLPRLIYFMDDDLFDTSITRGQSWRYRYKLAHLGAWQKNWLSQMDTEYWVSTLWLQEKYKHLTPKLIEPKPLAHQEQLCRVFYHGSASHADEIRWLHPIMQTLLKENEQIVFEIIGDANTNRLYRNLPRVNVVHPMKWPAYQAFIAMPGRDIGLAPMLDNAFNQSRSYTKFFDISRAGAAGIFSAAGPWKKILTHDLNGLIVPTKPSAWIETIHELVSDAQMRKRLTEEANKTVAQINAQDYNLSATLRIQEKRIR